jgi:hypothetical protein
MQTPPYGDCKQLPVGQGISEASTLAGDRDHAIPQSAIVRARGLVSDGHAAAADGFTRPPFAHRVMLHEMRDGFPLGGGRHH